MAVRSIITDSSLWLFDFEAMEFSRSPRVEGAGHDYVRYEGGWQPFDVLEERRCEGHPDRIRFVVWSHDLPDGQGGYITSTYKPGEQ